MDGGIKNIRREANATVVEVHGELGPYCQAEFEKTLLTVCNEQPDVLIIEFSQVSYVDSAGLGALVKVSHKMREYKRKLAIVGLIPRVKGVFETTALDRYFTICDTEQDALALADSSPGGGPPTPPCG